MQRALSALATLLVLVFLAAGTGAYLLVSGPHLPMLRAVAGSLGRVFAGQRTEHLSVDVRVFPETGRLAGEATLTVRSEQDGRRFFYFLLDDGLRVRDVRLRSAASAGLTVYSLALLTVVDLGTELGAGKTVELVFDYDGRPGRGSLALSEAAVAPNRVFLGVDSFWYPSDLQGFFTADVSVTLPSALTVVHNAVDGGPLQRGAVHTVRWQSERPLGGMSLLAGRYALSASEKDGVEFRVYVAEGLDLDTGRILEHTAAANRILSERLGPSGFDRVTLCIDPDFQRAFNDGSGVLGVSTRHLRGGDYGFGLIAHEVAHNWWGGTVAERWLAPGTGGQWIVEGFAEFSSLVATEARYGTDALRERLAREFFDPRHDRAVSTLSAIDNGLDERSRDTIYRKGAYVAYMLRQILGADTYFNALREFLARFRHRQASHHDLRAVLEEVSERSLEEYFADWLDSDRALDLTLDALNERTVTVHNLGTASLPGKAELWAVTEAAREPRRSAVSVDDRVPLGSAADDVILDPDLQWADVERANNRYPRRREALFLNARNGQLLLTEGDPYPWTRSSVSLVNNAAQRQHVWDFASGMACAPRWSPNGKWVVASHDDGKELLPEVVLLSTEDGARRSIGRGSDPAPAADGTVYAAKGDRIVRFAADGTEAPVARHEDGKLRQPLPAPGGRHLAYAAEIEQRVELRALDLTDGADRLLGSWPRDRLRYLWSADGSLLYVISPGTWDWELWEVPLEPTMQRRLVDHAVSIADFALAPDGGRVAFTAVPELEDPPARHRLYVLEMSSQRVQEIDADGLDLGQLSWLDPESLLAVATEVTPTHTAVRRRALKRIRLPEGTVESVAH